MLVPLQLHLWRFALHTGVQRLNTNALQHCSGPHASHVPSAAMQNWLTTCLCLCKYTYGDWLFIQICSDPTPMLLSTAQGQMHPIMPNAALQNWLTTCLCLCKHTYGDLLFIQSCSDPTNRKYGKSRVLPPSNESGLTLGLHGGRKRPGAPERAPGKKDVF